MSANLPDLSGVIGAVTAGTAMLNSILVIKNGIGFDLKGTDGVAFLFQFREEDSTDLRSDITDNYTESNIAFQDEIALKPITTTLHGFIGELTDFREGLQGELNLIASQLTVFAPYSPALTSGAMAAFNQASQIYNAGASAVETVSQVFNMAMGGLPQTKQQKAYSYFKMHWMKRDLFTVITPWETLNNMAIEDIHAVQEGDTNTMSDFRITFKQIQYAKTISPGAQGRRAAQDAAGVNQGTQNSSSVDPLSPGGDNSAVLIA